MRKKEPFIEINDMEAKLIKKTLMEYGKNPYKDGTIAAQSMHIVSSSTDKTLFGPACGTGSSGRNNDAVYADFITSACCA